MQNIRERLTRLWPEIGASSRRTARFAVSISASLTAGLTASVDMGKRIFKKNHGFSARCPAFFFRNLTCLEIKISKTSKFSRFECSYSRVKLLLTCNTIKGANSSDKIK